MPSNKRPSFVTLMAVGVLIFATSQMVRLALSFHLPNLPLSVPTWYLALTGGIWGTLAILVSLGLFRGRTWAPALLCWGSLAYAAWFWMDWILFVRSEYARGSWLFNLIFMLLVLLGIAWLLRRPALKRYFGEREYE